MAITNWGSEGWSLGLNDARGGMRERDAVDLLVQVVSQLARVTLSNRENAARDYVKGYAGGRQQGLREQTEKKIEITATWVES